MQQYAYEENTILPAECIGRIMRKAAKKKEPVQVGVMKVFFVHICRRCGWVIKLRCNVDD